MIRMYSFLNLLFSVPNFLSPLLPPLSIEKERNIILITPAKHIIKMFRVKDTKLGFGRFIFEMQVLYR